MEPPILPQPGVRHRRFTTTASIAVAALLGIAAGFWLGGRSKPPATSDEVNARQKVAAVMRAERELSIRVAAKETAGGFRWDRKPLLAEYTSGLARIDLRGCPGDFREAFEAYRHAWESHQEFADRYTGTEGFTRYFCSWIRAFCTVSIGPVLDGVVAPIADHAQTVRKIESSRELLKGVASRHEAQPSNRPEPNRPASKEMGVD